MIIKQYEIVLKPKPRGYHLVTDEIEGKLIDLKQFKAGIANVFIQHTSASLTINENADPTVRMDFNTYFDRLVPENPSLYRHTSEGLDDMTSHIKTSILGNTLSIPISNGAFNIGAWQGIYLCEHRNSARSRRIVVTIIGEEYGK